MRSSRCTLVFGSMLLCGCSNWDHQPETGLPPLPSVAETEFVPPAEGEGFQLAIEYDAPALTETWSCFVGELPESEGLVHPINKVLSRQNDSVHHMVVIILPFAEEELPLGLHDCEELYSSYPSVMETGLSLFGSQNAKFDAILPEGVVAPVPGKIQYVHELHYINVNDDVEQAWSKINAYTIPNDEVVDSINGFSKNDRSLSIPPQAKHTEWTRCVMNKDIDVLFMTSHTHELGELFEVHLFDGQDGLGDLVYVNDDWHAPPLKPFTEEPLHIPAGTGFQWSCHFNNHREHEVNWGLTTEDEMCQMIIAFTPGDFDISCDVVETSN